MRQARLIAPIPADRVYDSDGTSPKVGDIVQLDQGFTFPDGRPGGMVCCVRPDGHVMWEAAVYDSELELLAETHNGC